MCRKEKKAVFLGDVEELKTIYYTGWSKKKFMIVSVPYI